MLEQEEIIRLWIRAGGVIMLLAPSAASAGISVPGMKKNSPGMVEMKWEKLVVYRNPKAGEELTVFLAERELG
ncbi:MAG: hypothetical protein WAO76_02130 [Georgfuchsia sp.]